MSITIDQKTVLLICAEAMVSPNTVKAWIEGRDGKRHVRARIEAAAKKLGVLPARSSSRSSS